MRTSSLWSPRPRRAAAGRTPVTQPHLQRRRRQLLCAALALLALLVAAPLRADRSFPTYVDPERSVEKQREAAAAAARVVARGSAAIDEVFPLLADPSGVVRDRVVEDIIKKWSDDDLLPLAPGLLARESLIAEGVAEILGRRRLGAAVPALTGALKRNPSEEVRLICLWALGEIGDPQAWEEIEKLIKREKRSYRLRGDALIALARLDAARARPLIESGLEEKRLLPLRIAALEALLCADEGAAVAAATALIREPPRDRGGVWGGRLLSAALDTLRGVEGRSKLREPLVLAIDAVIARLPEAEARARRDLIEALKDVTGVRDLPDAPYAWEGWWRMQREKWQPPAGRARPGKKGAGEDAAEEGEGRTGVVRYHGIPVDSLRVTFLMDLSGGMGRGIDGSWESEGPTRLDVSKEELDRVLRKLHERAYVNVVTFASFFYSASEAPLSLKRARGRFLDFNSKQKIPRKRGHSRGNIYDALAFTVTRPHVDTVYLLTEGAPTEGKFHDYGRFLSHFRRLNRYSRVKVYTLLMGKTGGRNRAFLQELAEGTGGSFHDLVE